MKQVDYFKFMKAFPEFIDIDDTDEVKIALLNIIKKQTRKNKEKSSLLPVRKLKLFEHIDIDFFKKRADFMNGHYIYKIKYRGEVLFTVYYLGENSEYSRADVNTAYKLDKLRNRSRFMEKEEVTNLKRTMLIDNMLK